MAGASLKRASAILPGWVGLVAMTVLSACGGAAGDSGNPGGLKVVTTVTQVSALVREVGGHRIALTALLTSKDDPHQYELKPDQVTRLTGSRLVFESGAGLDKWMDRALAATGGPERVVDLSRSVRLRQSQTEGVDPHWWYDIDNAKLAVDAIAAALGGADPAGRDAYERNAAAAKLRLDDADRQIHALIDPIPASKRLFVANHDAFNYFLERYGITLVGDIIPSTDSIAAVRPADVARLVKAIRDRHVCAVFTETTLDPRLASEIARDAGVKVVDGKLYADAIGDPGSEGATLEQALLHNGRLMAQAFTSC